MCRLADTAERTSAKLWFRAPLWSVVLVMKLTVAGGRADARTFGADRDK
jgi:hypothetical protein